MFLFCFSPRANHKKKTMHDKNYIKYKYTPKNRIQTLLQTKKKSQAKGMMLRVEKATTFYGSQYTEKLSIEQRANAELLLF